MAQFSDATALMFVQLQVSVSGMKAVRKGQMSLLSFPPFAYFRCSPDLKANSTEQTECFLLTHHPSVRTE